MAWNEPPGGGRDPWNQGNRGGGAPDLDQMLERLKARFKGKGPRPAGLSSGGTGLLLSSIALLWILTGFYSVDEQERAVVMRFGAYVGTTDPGPRWHLPWPIEDVEKVNVTQIRQATERADMLTRDESVVDVELKVQYRVASAEKYLFRLQDPDGTLRLLTKSAVREVVGAQEMEAIFSAGGRQQISEQTQKILQGRLDAYDSGLKVTDVNLQNAQVPEPVQGAFADAIKAREDQARLKNEAETYANERVPKARGAAARQVAEAVGDREQRIVEAQGDSARFTKLLAEYRKAPRVTRDRLYLEMMSDVLSHATKVVIDVGKNGPAIYLPLDQLRKDGSRSSGDGDATTPASSAPRAGAQNDSRSRDRGGR